MGLSGHLGLGGLESVRILCFWAEKCRIIRGLLGLGGVRETSLQPDSQVALIIYCIDRAHLSATLRGSNSSLEIAAASGALPVSAVAVHLID
jgi:hypothetical protein